MMSNSFMVVACGYEWTAVNAKKENKLLLLGWSTIGENLIEQKIHAALHKR